MTFRKTSRNLRDPLVGFDPDTCYEENKVDPSGLDGIILEMNTIHIVGQTTKIHYHDVMENQNGCGVIIVCEKSMKHNDWFSMKLHWDKQLVRLTGCLTALSNKTMRGVVFRRRNVEHVDGQNPIPVKVIGKLSVQVFLHLLHDCNQLDIQLLTPPSITPPLFVPAADSGRNHFWWVFWTYRIIAKSLSDSFSPDFG